MMYNSKSALRALLLLLSLCCITHALLQSTCPTLPAAFLQQAQPKSHFWDGVLPTLPTNRCLPATLARDASGNLFHTTDGSGLTRLLRRRARTLAPEPTLTFFYKRSCKWSAQLLRSWAQVAARMPVCSVAIEARRVPALPAALGVHGIPAAVVYWPGRPDSKYTGDRSFQHLLQWAVNATARPPRREAWTGHAMVLEIANGEHDVDWALIVASLVSFLAGVRVLVQKFCVKFGVGDEHIRRPQQNVPHRERVLEVVHENVEE